MADLGDLEIYGKPSNGNCAEEANRVMRSLRNGFYMSDVQSLASNSTRTKWSTLSTGFFTNVPRVCTLEIYSGFAISVGLRTRQNTGTTDANLPLIPIRANTLRRIDFVGDITDLVFYNASGSVAAIEVTAA